MTLTITKQKPNQFAKANHNNQEIYRRLALATSTGELGYKLVSIPDEKGQRFTRTAHSLRMFAEDGEPLAKAVYRDLIAQLGTNEQGFPMFERHLAYDIGGDEFNIRPNPLEELVGGLLSRTMTKEDYVGYLSGDKPIFEHQYRKHFLDGNDLGNQAIATSINNEYKSGE